MMIIIRIHWNDDDHGDADDVGDDDGDDDDDDWSKRDYPCEAAAQCRSQRCQVSLRSVTIMHQPLIITIIIIIIIFYPLITLYYIRYSLLL